MAQNTPILLSDYNVIQESVRTTLGTGYEDYGYGQSITSSQLTLGTNIQSAQWNRLRIDVLKAYRHRTGVLTDPIASNGVSLSEIAAGASITEAMRFAFEEVAQQNSINRLQEPPASQATRESLVSLQRTTIWNGTLYHEVTVTFANANAARYFFNSGSSIEFRAERLGAASSGSKNEDWTSLLSSMGTIKVSAHEVTAGSGAPTTAIIQGKIDNNGSPTAGTRLTVDSIVSGVIQVGQTISGTGIISGTKIVSYVSPGIYTVDEPQYVTLRQMKLSCGFYELTSTNQKLFEKIGTSPYAVNDYSILAKINPAKTQITFTIQFNDDIGKINSVDENVSGTLNSYVQVYRATGANVEVAKPVGSTGAGWIGGAPIVPTFEVHPNTLLVTQGQVLTYTVTTTNYIGPINWEISGTIGSGQISGTSGTINVQSSPSDSQVTTFNVTISTGLLLDSNKSIILKLKVSGSEVQNGTAETVTLLAPIYRVSANRSTVYTQNTITYTLTPENVGTTTVVWSAKVGATTDFANRYGLPTSGQLNISNDSPRSFSWTIPAASTEGANTVFDFDFKLSNNTQVASAPQVTFVRPTYMITPVSLSVIQNGSTTLAYTITTTNLTNPNPVTLNWAIEGSSATNFTAPITGTVTITNNTGSISVGVARNINNAIGSNSTATLRLRNTVTTVPANELLETSTPVQLIAPTYDITPSTGVTINEGDSVTFTVTTANVINPSNTPPTTLYWSTAGSASAADFTDNTLTGLVTLNGSGTGSIVRTTLKESTSSAWYSTSYPAWGTFMNNYAVWKGPQNTAGTQSDTFTVNFTSAGTYSIEYSSDDSMIVTFIDPAGNTIKTINSPGNFTTSAYETVNIAAAGIYSIRIAVTNAGITQSGNPGGAALRISSPGSNAICISVIDSIYSDGPSFATIEQLWNEFRAKYPTRKFYLLCPTTNLSQTPAQLYNLLRVPTSFQTDPNAFGPIAVSKDNGSASLRSDWFALCNFNQYPAGTQVSLLVDNSGSMRTTTVEASRAYFRTRIASAGFTFAQDATMYSVSPLWERWPNGHDVVGTEVTNTRIFALAKPAETNENFKLSLRLGSSAGEVIDESGTVTIVEPPMIETVTSITNLYTSWGPDSAGGYHAITFDWTTSTGRTGHVSNDIHLSSIISSKGYNGTFATSLIGRNYEDADVKAYLNAGLGAWSPKKYP